MSGPEHFLSRWSRLKQEDKTAAAPSPGEAAPPAQGESGNAASSVPLEPPRADAKEDQLFDLTALPSLDSITAATDIKPFLAAGVPAELRHAALRRAWSADPQIRDFVGLAEYAWDFNAPDSMPGFGPLEMTDELRRFARNIVGERDPEPEAAVAPSTESEGDRPETAELPSPEQSIDDVVQRSSDDVAAHSLDIELQPADPASPRRGGGALPT